MEPLFTFIEKIQSTIERNPEPFSQKKTTIKTWNNKISRQSPFFKVQIYQTLSRLEKNAATVTGANPTHELKLQRQRCKNLQRQRCKKLQRRE
jgi:hypothetical protein